MMGCVLRVIIRCEAPPEPFITKLLARSIWLTTVVSRLDTGH